MYYVVESQPLTWDEARLYVFSLGDGWRIPSYNEIHNLLVREDDDPELQNVWCADQMSLLEYEQEHFKKYALEDEYYEFTLDYIPPDWKTVAEYVDGRVSSYNMVWDDFKANLIVIKGEQIYGNALVNRTFRHPLDKPKPHVVELHPLLAKYYPELVDTFKGE